MGRRAALAACLCGVLLFAPALHASDATSASKGQRLLLQEINRARAAAGVPPLRADSKLEAAATAHSRDMLAHGYMGHGDFGRRLQSYGVHRRAIGENLAWGAGRSVPARYVVSQWMSSDWHRANLLSREFRRVGIGIAVGSFGGQPRAYIVTADFSA